MSVTDNCPAIFSCIHYYDTVCFSQANHFSDRKIDKISYQLVLTCVVGAQKNRLNKTHNQ